MDPDLRGGPYLYFVMLPMEKGRHTPTVEIRSRRTRKKVGVFKWKGRRGFSFWPEPDTVFGPVCMGDVVRVMTSLNEAYESGKEGGEHCASEVREEDSRERRPTVREYGYIPRGHRKPQVRQAEVLF